MPSKKIVSFSITQVLHKQLSQDGWAYSTITAWDAWVAFTADLALNPFSKPSTPKYQSYNIEFAPKNYQQMAIPSGINWLEYAQAVAQAFLALGDQDPCLTLTGKIDLCIQQKDPSISWVEPIPIQGLKYIAFVAANLSPGWELLEAIANMIIIAPFSFSVPTIHWFHFCQCHSLHSDQHLIHHNWLDH